MGTGILICGLNGCGKSTIGKARATKIGFHFIDNEDLFFPEAIQTIRIQIPELVTKWKGF